MTLFRLLVLSALASLLAPPSFGGDLQTAREAEIAVMRTELWESFQAIDALHLQRGAMAQLLDTLGRAAPKSLTLNTVKREGNHLVVKGIANDDTQLATFLSNLEASPWLDEVSLLKTNRRLGQGHRGKEFLLEALLLGPSPPLPQAVPEIEVLTEQLRKAAWVVPLHQELPDALNRVSMATNKAGLETRTVQPMPEVKHEILARTPVIIEVVGTYREMILFFHHVTDLSRMIIVGDLELSTLSPKSPHLRLHAELLVYRMIAPEERDSSVAGPPPGEPPLVFQGPPFAVLEGLDVDSLRDPFHVRPPEPDTATLATYDLYNLEVVEVDCSDGAQARIRGPEGTIHVLRLGTKIGKNFGKVTGFHCPAIEITEEFQAIDGSIVTSETLLSMPEGQYSR